MKKLLAFIVMVLLLSVAANAQQRSIARGAVEGELYMNIGWYTNYNFLGDTAYNAILHITENGKKVEMKYTVLSQGPDALTGESLPMQTYFIMADATSGVVYIADWYMTYEAIENNRLWFSDDYGKTWELRDKPVYKSAYVAANVEGLIYRSGGWGYGGGVYRSTDYGETFIKMEDMPSLGKESGLEDCNFFSLIGRGFYHTYDCFENYINITIDTAYVYGGFPDVFRGGLPGEVYVTSQFPNNIYKVSFSADTGYNFRVVHQRQSYIDFMSDRKAGDFYIITRQVIETQQPWGYYMRVCIEHYTDYGETLVGTYCHDLTREGVVTGVDEMEKGDGIVVYPNPASGELRVTSYKLRVTNIEVLDVFGRTVGANLRVCPESNAINISHLPAGMYFIRITTDKGTTTKKIIKK